MPKEAVYVNLLRNALLPVVRFPEGAVRLKPMLVHVLRVQVERPGANEPFVPQLIPGVIPCCSCFKLPHDSSFAIFSRAAMTISSPCAEYLWSSFHGRG